MHSLLLSLLAPSGGTTGKDSEIRIIPTPTYTSRGLGTGGVAFSEDGNILAVGSSYELSNTGVVHIFQKSGSSWSQIARLSMTGIGTSPNFGSSVSLTHDGSTIAVGALNATGLTATSGAAFIFKRTEGTNDYVLSATLNASDGANSANFGKAISITPDGEVVLVSAILAYTGTPRTGAVYLYEKSGETYIQVKKLVNEAAAAMDGSQFGYSMKLSANGNFLIVGARRYRNAVVNAGAAFIYQRSGNDFVLLAKVMDADKLTQDHFGSSVAITNDGLTAVVGVPGRDEKATGYGAAYIYTKPGVSYALSKKIFEANQTSASSFGECVDISANGETIVGSGPSTSPITVFNINNGLYDTANSWLNSDNIKNIGAVAVSPNSAIIAAAAPDTPSTGVLYMYTNKILEG